MALDPDTVRRVAALARLRLEPEEAARMQTELNGILAWIEQLQAVDTEGVEPMAGGDPLGGGDTRMRMRDDVVTEGGDAARVVANAPDRIGDSFAVPKVVE